MIREDEVYKIGMLTKTHGVSGELNMAFTTMCSTVWKRSMWYAVWTEYWCLSLWKNTAFGAIRRS